MSDQEPLRLTPHQRVIALEIASSITSYEAVPDLEAGLAVLALAVRLVEEARTG